MSPWGRYFLEYVIIRADGKIAGIDGLWRALDFDGVMNTDLLVGLDWRWAGRVNGVRGYLEILCEMSLDADPLWV